MYFLIQAFSHWFLYSFSLMVMFLHRLLEIEESPVSLNVSIALRGGVVTWIAFYSVPFINA